jgi:hypothetical protein
MTAMSAPVRANGIPAEVDKAKQANNGQLPKGEPQPPQKPQNTAPTKPGQKLGGSDFSSSAEKKSDGMATVNSIAAGTGLRAQAVAGWADENGVNLSKVADDLKSKKLKPMDFMTAVSGNPGNKYAKDVISKYSQSSNNSDDSAGGSNDKANTIIKGLKPAKYGGKHPDSMEMGGSLY